MTYGWAILIIAIVLVALVSLGVFSPHIATQAPGSCSITRNVYGGAEFSGACTSLPPQFVADIGPSTSDQIIVNYEFFQGDSFTILAWVYWPPGTNLASGPYRDIGYAWSGPPSTDNGFGIFSRSDSWYLNFFADDLSCSTGPVAGKWYQFGASWNSNTKLQTIWVNGAGSCNRTSNGDLITNTPLYIGSPTSTWDSGNGGEDGGYLSNIQIYNTSLSQPEIQALYQEGIGGVPINLRNLVGWWPLNGNAQDYSGNGNNGAATNVIYISNWYSNYVQP